MSKIKKGLLVVFFIILIAVIAFLSYVFINIMPVNKSDKSFKTVVIESGMSRGEIAEKLEEEGIIRNSKIFYYYVKLKKVDNIYAATYKFSPSMEMSKVLDVLIEGGENTNTLFITFKEGINMREVAKVISEKTDNTEDDVYNKLSDSAYLDSLINKYWFIDEDIKNSNIYYSLEGYLYPETYNINKDSTVDDIFSAMLDEMELVLDNYKTDIEKSSYSVHELLTMASIVESEANEVKSRKDVASVFYNRLNNGMSLGSDVTTYYGAKIDMSTRDLTIEELRSTNSYNTRASGMIGKLPVGPISLPSRSSIEASIYPNDTDYLFFVADKNGKIYLTKTEAEHNAIISDLQNKGLWYEW